MDPWELVNGWVEYYLKNKDKYIDHPNLKAVAVLKMKGLFIDHFRKSKNLTSTTTEERGEREFEDERFNLEQSLQFAEEIDLEFSSKANRKSRGVKQAPFYVISRTNMPSVLIECGFLTNQKEEDFLQSDTGKDFIASAIFRAFKSYKEDVENINNSKEGLIEVNKPAKNFSSKEKKMLKENNEIIFKVQIGMYLKSMKDKQIFIDIEAEDEKKDGVFKYYVGAEINKSNAEKIKNKMINLGFDGTFIVAFYKDKRISIKEALDLKLKIKNNE